MEPGSAVGLGAGSIRLGERHGELGMMRDSAPLLGRPEQLRRRLAQDGYLLLRNLLPRELVLAGRRRIVSQLQGLGYGLALGDDSGQPPAQREAEGAAPPGMTYLHDVLPAPGAPPTPALLGKLGGAEAVQDEALLATPEVQAVVENPALHQLFAALLDTASVHALDYRWLRIVPPRQPSSFRTRSSSLLSFSA